MNLNNPLKEKVLDILKLNPDKWRSTRAIADELKHHPDQIKSILIELYYEDRLIDRAIEGKGTKNKYIYWKLNQKEVK